MSNCVSGEIGVVVHRGSAVRRGDGWCAGENDCVDQKIFIWHSRSCVHNDSSVRDSAVLDCWLLASRLLYQQAS